jgi:hypothetical protein
VEMKERFLESLAILLAGLFSAERPRPWQLGDGPRPHDGAADTDTPPSDSSQHKN